MWVDTNLDLLGECALGSLGQSVAQRRRWLFRPRPRQPDAGNPHRKEPSLAPPLRLVLIRYHSLIMRKWTRLILDII